MLSPSTKTRHALIVDDSKSARVILSRMLEKYGIDADTLESAEDAIEYLKGHRPDVIFMDHLMPGMDGFQAVQAIKNNPETATIPVMMYTSQEGELYVGQARALGAIGVMPKQVRAIDVSKVLYELNLLPDRRDPNPSAFRQPELALSEDGEQPPAAIGDAPIDGAAPLSVSAAPALMDIELRRFIESLFKDQNAELRRFMVASLDSLAHRINADTRDVVATATSLPPTIVETVPEPERPTGWIAAAVAGLLAAAVLGVVAWQLGGQLRELEASQQRITTESRQLRDEITRLQSAPSARPAAPEGPAVASAERSATPVAQAGAAPAAAAERASAPPTLAAPSAQLLPVPYGEIPLSGARVDAVRNALQDLEKHPQGGVLKVETFSGEFCLTGNPAEGYSLAPDELPANSCDLVGNPYDDALRPAQRQSVNFANLVAAATSKSAGAIEVTVVHVGRQRPVAQYPQGAAATAAQWNAAAAANQRVEITAQSR